MPPDTRPEVIARETLAIVKEHYPRPLSEGEVRDVFTCLIQALIPYSNSDIAYAGPVGVKPPRPQQMVAVLGYFMNSGMDGVAPPIR